MADVKAWSFSRWDMHHQCPLKFKLRHIDKLEEPAGEAMLRGRRVHNAIKDYLAAPFDAVGLQVPPEAGKASELVRTIREAPDWLKLVEQQWGYTRAWEATSWFGNVTWFRSILDVGIIYEDDTAEVVDWKTGKPRGTYGEEMELFAISFMQRAKQITHVTTRLTFTDFKHEEFAEFRRDEVPALIAKWERKVAPMFEDTTYLPRPNDGCKWCAFSKSKGGQCRYG